MSNPNMDRFPPPLHKENFVSPWRKEEIEADMICCEMCGERIRNGKGFECGLFGILCGLCLDDVQNE